MNDYLAIFRCKRRFTVAADTEVVIGCSKFATVGKKDDDQVCHGDYVQITIGTIHK